MKKSYIGVSLCCAAALLGTVAYAASPPVAADAASGSISGAALVDVTYTDSGEEESAESGRMARIRLEDGSPYVSLEDNTEETTGCFEIPSDGEVGDQYISGDMIIEIVTKDEVLRAASE